jgi:hypothetical protein
MASTATCAWLAFGAPRPVSARGLGEIHAVWMAVPGQYRCPEPIVRLANRREEPFLHTSHVAAMGKANVHRMTWHTPDYSLCSQWDQPGDPTSGLYKESRRHMLKWVSDKPSSTFAVCMENPHRPYALHENRANALGYGENGFAQYMQHEGTLLGLYSVPEKCGCATASSTTRITSSTPRSPPPAASSNASSATAGSSATTARC